MTLNADNEYSLEKLPDNDLVSLVLLGDPQAEQYFYDRFKRLVYSSVAKHHWNMTDDILQDSWVHVFSNLNKFDAARSSLVTFINNFAWQGPEHRRQKQCCAKRYRDLYNDSLTIDEEEENIAVTRALEWALRSFDHEQAKVPHRVDFNNELVRKKRQRDRVMTILVKEYGCTLDEVAEHFGVSRQTACTGSKQLGAPKKIRIKSASR